MTKNLWIQEVDVQEEIGRHWDAVYGYVAGLLHISGLEQTLAEELAIFPGMEEVSSLLYVNQYVREKTFDVILLDCAPTGESLRLSASPLPSSGTCPRSSRWSAGWPRSSGPCSTASRSVPLPQESYFDNLQDLHRKLEGIDKLLADPKITTVRLVTNPEKMVLKETQRAFTFFCLYGLTVDAVIINRILPAGLQDSFFSAWRETQERWTQAIEEFFAPVPVWRVPLFQDEVLGTERLRALAKTLFAGRDPSERFYHEAPYRFRKSDGNYQLRLRLPFVSSKDVSLHKYLDELIIRIGPIKRHVSLPQRMAQFEPLSARVTDGELVVVLGRNSDAAQSEKTTERTPSA